MPTETPAGAPPVTPVDPTPPVTPPAVPPVAATPVAPAAPVAGTPPATPPAIPPAAPVAPVATPPPPVTYALTVPKGSEPWLDDADVRSVEATAKANGWTNEEAQAQLDAHADVLAQQSTAFRTETEAHPVYGGEHLGETQRLANLVLDRFAASGDPIAEQLRRDLVKSGYGNKLSVIAFLARIGKTMAEDRSPSRQGPVVGGVTKDAAAVLYDGKS